jgi:hypothetical protein
MSFDPSIYSDKHFLHSNPSKAFLNTKKYLGKNSLLLPSTIKNKKYMVLNPSTNKMVSFGDLRYDDFLKHQSIQRKNNYIKRASMIKGDWKDDKYSPNNLSIHILWV